MSKAYGSRPTASADSGALPPERAFVVEFSAGAAARDDHFSGRVEHVVSGRAARFESAGELLEFVQGILASRKPAPNATP